MSANVWLGAMISASILAVATSSRWERPAPPPSPPVRTETPWLTPEAEAQLVGPEGRPGPLFEGAELGGPAPSAATRARIATFARTNKVEIKFEVVDGELAAIRFDVMFGGCCGYEGADTLAIRLGRPRTDSCCGCEKSWLDDWAFAHDGVYGRARVRVNRVMLRWEKEAAAGDVVERADGLLGRDRGAVAQTAGDHWIELEPGQRYLLEVPYVIDSYGLQERERRGIQVVVERGRIVEASFSIRDDREDLEDGTLGLLRSRWGRPRAHHDEAWTWRTADRTVEAALDDGIATVTARLSRTIVLAP